MSVRDVNKKKSVVSIVIPESCILVNITLEGKGVCLPHIPSRVLIRTVYNLKNQYHDYLNNLITKWSVYYLLGSVLSLEGNTKELKLNIPLLRMIYCIL